MKKGIAIVLSIVLICGITAAATIYLNKSALDQEVVPTRSGSAAEPKFETAEELYMSWELEDNYPPYVCGVVSSGIGSLTIGVTDSDEGRAGAGEILDLIEDDSTVSFIYQKYTYNELKEAQKAIFDIMVTNDIGGWESGIYQRENRVRVTIEDTYRDSADNLTALCNEKYGDMVSVTTAKDKFIATDD